MCTVYTLRWGKVEMASSWASFSDLGAWRCRITRWITGAGDWWQRHQRHRCPSVPVSMISVSITLRAKEPQVCQVCQVPMCHRNPVASSQSASLIQKLHSTSHPRCSIHVVIIGHHVSEIFWDDMLVTFAGHFLVLCWTQLVFEVPQHSWNGIKAMGLHKDHEIHGLFPMR